MCHDIQEKQAAISIRSLSGKKMDMYIQKHNKTESERMQFSSGAGSHSWDVLPKAPSRARPQQSVTRSNKLISRVRVRWYLHPIWELNGFQAGFNKPTIFLFTIVALKNTGKGIKMVIQFPSLRHFIKKRNTFPYFLRQIYKLLLFQVFFSLSPHSKLGYFCSPWVLELFLFYHSSKV